LIGTVLMASYAGLIVQFWRDNLWSRDDIVWCGRSTAYWPTRRRAFLKCTLQCRPEISFWSMALLVPVLFVTGLVIWDVYFSPYTTIEQQRIAVSDPQSGRSSGDHRLDHPCLCRDLGERVGAGHDAGYVTPGWAWRHHRKWLRRLAATGSAGPRPRA